ncbi:1397_t:CDS:2 [Paraglomus occultum]|uniref:1397_t:CDS:1 n=1 Tax=Paraglomus occultum TaxID=144539 RepID=A0A9N9D0Z3_9GLOM|nr:1397_t:CDS:2 [Paraglomus occultum]
MPESNVSQSGSRRHIPLRYRLSSLSDNQIRTLNRRTADLGGEPWFRHLKVGSLVLCAGITVYMVLYHDWNQDDHVFMPIRRWVDERKRSFWSLSNEEKQELREQGKKVD